MSIRKKEAEIKNELKEQFKTFLDDDQSMESSDQISYWGKIRGALLTTPLPGKQYSIDFKEDEKSIPRVQFGEKEINEEIVNVCTFLSDAIRMRLSYGHEFKFPWEKTTEMKETSVKQPEPYLGEIRIKGKPSSNEILRMKDGVVHVYLPHEPSSGRSTPHPSDSVTGVSSFEGRLQFLEDVSFDKYYDDYRNLCNFVKYAPAKTFCFGRLKFLKLKFELYQEMYAGKEMVDMMEVPHRDFYNVRKVDNHIHLAGCMNQKALLNYIRKKITNHGEDIVWVEKNGTKKTLREVFKEMNMDAHNISVDSLNVHADTGTFHRFDRFNQKFDPFGAKKLRSIFMKTDNVIQGKYFAELAKEVFIDFEKQKYQFAEPRVSLYGRSKNELKKLAHWVHDHKLYSRNIRWIIQVPRLFGLNKKMGIVTTFEDMMENIFLPFFEATKDPQKDPIVSNFLENYVVGFDSVDDESKVEAELYSNMPRPSKWGITPKTRKQNPPYAYYNYYMWANINVLNQFRKSKGMSTFKYRPHCGESGDVRHLASSFLLADGINHGIQLRNSPILSYLYYLLQIGLSVSPLSNNFLFLSYAKNPFPEFFRQGFNVALSTDDPLMFHFTKEPLMEEYSIAQQIMNFSTTDICEIARNSVLQSGWSDEHKQYFISRYYKERGVHNNNIKKTNVPRIRIQYRFETLLEEHLFIQSSLHHGNQFDVDTSNYVTLDRNDLVHEIHALRENKIELFGHSNQFNLVYPEDPENEEGKSPHQKVVYKRVLKVDDIHQKNELQKIKTQISDLRKHINDLKEEKRQLKMKKRMLKKRCQVVIAEERKN